MQARVKFIDDQELPAFQHVHDGPNVGQQPLGPRRFEATVKCNGGLSLIGEAVYLGKPIFSVPVRNQYEQVLNARYLEQLGYGLEAQRIEVDLLRAFLAEAPKYAISVIVERGGSGPAPAEPRLGRLLQERPA